MATPSAHKTTAETLLTAAAPRPELDWTLVEFALIHTHAALAKAAGTGTHYAAAEAALADDAAFATQGAFTGRLTNLQVALANALLAD